MTAMAREFDTVIVGGGLVGASLSLALASIGQRVGVIEAHRPGAPGQPSYDDRATALSNGSQRVFAALGVWPGLAGFATPIRAIHVSDKGRFGISRINAREEGVEALGFMVRNRHIGSALMDALTKQPLIELLAPATVARIDFSEAGVDVVCARTGDVQQSTTLRCRLLVGADGARSSVRALLGIDAATREYKQLAVIANVSTERELRGVAYERFTEEGPIAILPMSDEDAPGRHGRATIVWSVAADQGQSFLAMDDTEFLGRLQAQFGYRLGKFLRAGKRASYPLALVQSEEQVRHRLVIIGNAAHSLHPVAGQGFNLSLRDVAALAETIAEAQVVNEDHGSQAVLDRYATWRERDQRDVIRFSDGLIKVFGSSDPLTRFGRNLGLLALELLPGAKHLVARQTMGVAGRLPRLARGLALK